jgi:hypothetical protein
MATSPTRRPEAKCTVIRTVLQEADLAGPVTSDLLAWLLRPRGSPWRAP